MQIKLFNYSNNKFNLLAIIDDIQQASFEHNYYAAGQFTITLNYNIPNAKLFKRGLFVQFGSSPYDFGEITSITNSIGENGKGSEFVNITGYDARYLFKRRIISNLNNNDAYNITADGETCIRSLISSQCTGKRSLPVNMGTAGTLGETYTVSESYSNLYDVLQTIATQTNIGWRLKFSSGALTLEVYQGEDKSKSVFFSEEMDSLKNGTYQDSNTSYANAILIAGKGSGSERDIYEGEELIDGDSPAGLDRFEAFDNQAELTTTEEYETEADAMLRQYGQTLTVQGAGLIKSPYVFREQYDIGDYITLSFSDKTAKVQITSVTEQISWNNKTLSFTFGKPVNGLDRQLDLMLKKIQSASSATSEASTNSVKWYTTPTDTAQDAGDVTFNTLGFTGSGGTFTLYLDDEKTGSKSYHLYIKNLTASLVLTTNKGATDLTLISGSYIANIFVDEDGNIINQGMTATSAVEAGNNQPVTSDGVNSAINALDVSSVGGSGKYISAISETDGKISATVGSIDTAVTSGSSNPITSGAVASAISNVTPINYIGANNTHPVTSAVLYKQKYWYDDGTNLSASGWYKIATFGKRNHGCAIQLKLASAYYNSVSGSHNIKLNYGWRTAYCLDFALDTASIFSKIKLCYNENNNDIMALYVYYDKNVLNTCVHTIDITSPSSDRNVTVFDFVTDSTVYDSEIEYNLGTDGLYVNGVKIN